MLYPRVYIRYNKILNIRSKLFSNYDVPKLVALRNYTSEVRVRFAPSPTGFLHLGGLRTAFYNFLFAKSNNGKFILRIEDTDASRTIPGAAQSIENDLIWLSIIPDESPTNGGRFGPYTQSERSQIYKEYSQVLLDNGTAYKCFCSVERLKSLSDAKQPYDNKCKSLTSREISELENNSTPYCIRLKLQKEVRYLNDIIYGEREFNIREMEGDTVIVKSNGVPTYHLANVIDDHLMNITHVLRGNEWLASTSKHLQLYKCFDWKPPIFGHLPNILNQDGTKLSKRQQDLHIHELRSRGYSPEAVLNFTKLSGGGFEDIDHETIISIDELVKQFTVNRINLNSAVLDLTRLQNYSRLDLRKKISNEEGLKALIDELKKIIAQNFKDSLCADYSDNFYKEVLLWGQDRIYKLNDFCSPEFKYLWTHPDVSKDDFSALKFDSKIFLFDLMEALRVIDSSSFTKETWSDIIKSIQNRYNLKAGPVMKLIRMVVCGVKVGPPINEVFTLLGQEIVLHRLSRAQSCL